MPPNPAMNRRQFIATTGLAAAGASLPLAAEPAARGSNGVNWPVGCFNRPWLGAKNKWNYDIALDGIKGAGYTITGLLTRPGKDEPFIGSDATPEYLAGLKKRIAAHDLKVVMGALRTRNELPLDAQIADMRKQ